MLSNILAQYIGIGVEEVQRLLTMNPEDLYQDESYKNLLAKIDPAVLEATKDLAHEVYQAELPAFMDEFSRKYDFRGTPMSPYTLVDWLLAYVNHPAQLPDLEQRHMYIPPSLILEGLPRLLEILSHMPQGKEEWQRAMCLLSIPLIARNYPPNF